MTKRIASRSNAARSAWMTLAMIACLAGSTGCDTIHGSGIAVEDRRDVPPFDAVEVEAGLIADLTIGPQDVVVRGDDNIVPSVSTTVEGGVLHVVPEHDFDPVVPLRIEVHTPALRRAALRAGGRLIAHDIETEELALSVNAGGDLAASGAVQRLRVELSAGGTLDASQMPAASVMLHGEAGGLIVVWASGEVEGTVESGAEALVLGAPAIRDVETSSGGTVHYE